MKTIEKRIDEIRPYEKNPRKNENAVEAVAASLKEFGWKQPIVVDRNNVVVAGHTRIKAAEQLGMTSVPCVIADDLTEEQVKAYRLADNKTAELAEWDENLLPDELKDIAEIDMEAFGFFQQELENENDAIEDEYTEEDRAGKIESRANKGDLFQLGDHRLLCGDSTSIEAQRIMMGGLSRSSYSQIHPMG